MRAGTTVTARIHGRFPARLEEIRYQRTSDQPGYYKHAFQTPTNIFALTDGGLLIRPTSSGGPMETTKLWLDNGKKKHHGRRHHRRNPWLAAYNPSATAVLKSYASLPYAMAALSGGAGFATTFLGSKVLLGLGPLAAYGADPGYTGILVRTGGRLVAAAAGDFALVRFLSGHNRIAYIGGAAAYIGLSAILEALGYQVTVGSGLPLASIIPTALQPAPVVAGVGGTGAFIRRPRAIAGAGAFIRQNGLGVHRMFQNRLSPA